jgi:hypothetical protein
MGFVLPWKDLIMELRDAAICLLSQVIIIGLLVIKTS